MRNDFAVFILSHGRPDRLFTLNTLRKGNYSGKWYIVIDNEDETAEEYYIRCPDHVIQFDKAAIAKTFDTADLSNDRRTIVYARNACFEIATRIGVKYFLELDDDYTDFQSRIPQDGRLFTISRLDLDNIFSAMLDFFEKSGALSVAFAQGGDFIGGISNPAIRKRISRKCMNSFFCSVERPFKFLGRINEDVNTYTTLASRGNLFFTVLSVMLVQKTTQHNRGGMTDVYLDRGTYLKSFYSVMMMPSAVKIGVVGEKHIRIHHRITWNNTCPRILHEKWRKP